MDDVVRRALTEQQLPSEGLKTLQRSDGMFILSDGKSGIGCSNPVDLMEVR